MSSLKQPTRTRRGQPENRRQYKRYDSLPLPSCTQHRLRGATDGSCRVKTHRRSGNRYNRQSPG
jgi:hypothetical protein